jgi:hypothetical protein
MQPRYRLAAGLTHRLATLSVGTALAAAPDARCPVDHRAQGAPTGTDAERRGQHIERTKQRLADMAAGQTTLQDRYSVQWWTSVLFARWGRTVARAQPSRATLNRAHPEIPPTGMGFTSKQFAHEVDTLRGMQTCHCAICS